MARQTNLLFDSSPAPFTASITLEALGLANLTGSTVTATGTVTTTSSTTSTPAPRATQAIGADIAGHSQSVALTSLFKLPTGTGAPAILSLNVLDRIEYTAGFNTKSLDTVTAGKVTTALTSNGGDAMTAGLVFTWQATTGRYVNAAGAYLDQVTLTTGTNTGDQACVSLYSCTSAAYAASYAASSTILASNPAIFAYQASVTLLTQASAAAVPAQATPGGIAAAALSMVGQNWNDNGCWVLASTIAAKDAASLPATSTLVGISGASNGEWVVAYNGQSGASSNWSALLKAGEMVSFVTTAGGGHITTVVSGSGSTAMLVDNMAVQNSNGSLANSANDGQAADIKILAPHAASQEFTGVNPALVCVYALDAPIVTTTTAQAAVALTKSVSLATDFTASNPVAAQAVTTWQLYDLTQTDHLALAGVSEAAARSAATAFSTASLTSVTLVAGATAGTDTVMARAFNGSYWGDWTSLAVKVG